MAFNGPLRARTFWQELESQTRSSKPAFVRSSSARSSFSSSTDKVLQSRPVIQQSIYCTIRNPKSRRSTSAPGQRATITPVVTPVKPTIHYPNNIQRRLETKAMSENELSLPTNKKVENFRAPKRYETSCYFKPLAVPVWYSTSIMLKVNSTKKKYTESVTYKNKLVPYRYVEKMTTVTSKPPKFMSNLEIQREVPLEHYLSLEPQQKAAFNKPFKSDHSITVDKYN